VPLIARWPGHVAPGRTSALVAAGYDVLPTVLELAGAALPGEIDGVSFARELLGEAGQPAHEFLYWEFHGYGGQQAVRLGRWKGIRRDLLYEVGPLELYDLETDEGERRDVAAKQPEIVERMLAILEREHRPSAEFRFALLDGPRGF
jgi:arylsulfatase A-like enzyme